MFCYMLSDYLKKFYGEKLYKLSLSSGMTCPNRDGTCGEKGCIFCSSKGSGEFTQDSSLSTSEQIEKAKLNTPTKSGKYIAYFQSFTNTYSTPDKIKELYTPVINRDDIAILSIATRPDCLSDDIIEVLSELNKIKPIWIELGLQTTNDKTADFIRRGYPLSAYAEAVTKLRSEDIAVITHLILGLPGENKEDMLSSARFAGNMSDGIKFHMLYITEDSDLADLYKQKQIDLLSRDEYIDILCDCIRVIPKNVVIHRMTGDADKNKLLAPKWSAGKIRLLREINNALYDRDITQGEALH